MFDTGSVLTSICNEIAIIFETNVIGLYATSVKIYQYLLHYHYHTNKRGKWYTRITIDLDKHLNQPLVAFNIVKR